MRAPEPPFAHLHLPLPSEVEELPPRARCQPGRLFRDPVEVVVARRPDEVVPALARVEAAAADGLWAAGYVAYGAWAGLEPRAAVRTGGSLPLVWFGLFREPARTAPVVPDGALEPGEAGDPDELPADAPSGTHPGAWEPEWDAASHASRVERIRRAIRAGDVYQVNLTFRMRAGAEGSPIRTYRRMLRSQGRAYGVHVATGSHHLLSASPELFLLRRGADLETRPMKGTVARGRWPAEDRARAETLLSSAKDRAENAMIVDLLRNDLGRVCRFGTVEVPRAFRVEAYRTVHQMTSTVRGLLREDAGLVDVFRALFPCGSVTGAPKLAAGALIEELETSARGAYCGAAGMVVPGGDYVFNVAIRTLEWDVRGGCVVYGTGGGVTWDSSPAGEHAEAVRKAEVLRSPPPRFDLLETLRVEAGRPVRLERHTERLLGSAAYWDFDVDPAALHDAVAGAAAACGGGLHRLGVVLDPSGVVRAETEPLEGPVARDEDPRAADRPRRAVVLDDEPVDPDDPLLFHKTTLREPYRRRRARRPDAWDVLLVNRRGEVTETTRANLVAEIGGELLTPPLECGLLPGVLRDEALERGRVREAVLTADAVRGARRLWALSSLRGWVPLELVGAG